jgi:hypothetical protein
MKKSISINSDIARHNSEISDIKKKLSDCISNNDGTNLAKMEIEAYQRLLKNATESRSRIAAELFKK